MPELRWCVREENRIERARGARAMSRDAANSFNERVDDYLSRCGPSYATAGEISIEHGGKSRAPHPDCRWPLILIVALHNPSHYSEATRKEVASDPTSE